MTLCCVGCRKDTLREVELSMQPFTTLAKVALNNDYTLSWHEDDRLCVNGQTVTVSGSSVTVPYSDYMYALYPAADMVSYSNGTYQVRLPRVQIYTADNNGNQHIEALMAASGSGSHLVFENLFSLLKVTVPAGVTVLYIDVNTTDSTLNMSGCGTVTFSNDGPQFAFGSSDVYPYTRLDCGAGVCRTDRTYYVAVPAFAGKKLTVTLCGRANGKRFRHIFTQATAATLLQSQYAQVPLAYTFSDSDTLYGGTDALCEPFSVRPTKQGYFAKGNLQFKYYPFSWRIATSQYECIGSANSAIGVNSTQWIDLFGWGTSGKSNCSMPWKSDMDNDSYYVGGGSDDNMTADTDWGSNIAHGWTTPTRNNWSYLLHGRPHSADKVAMARIDNQHNGLLILPDYWVLPEGCSFSTQQLNSYTLLQWAAMEAAGAMFLPAAGFREALSVWNVGSSGYYWTSERSNNGQAPCLQFGSTIADTTISVVNRFRGQSVRLIKK